jgi:hypothetical protein
MLNKGPTMNVALTLKSANVKTGPIPVSITGADSCPPSCPFSGGGCYAKGGPLAIHWRKVTQGDRGMPWSDFVAQIDSLPNGQLWRHNAAGDLIGAGETIDPVALGQLVKANQGKRGFTYTHKTNHTDNFQWIKAANDWGFTVNMSANSLDHADQLADIGAGPVVTVLPIDAPPKQLTPKGRTVVTCPATYLENVSCATCKLCAVSDRTTIVGFPAHGNAKAKVQTVFFAKVAQ